MKKLTRKFSSTEKILDILFLFFKHQELTAQQISKKLSLPLSSTYKYLEILLNRDLLGKSPGSAHYCLGIMAYKFGKLFMENKSFLTSAIAHMELLSNQTNATVFLSTISGWKMEIIEKIEPPLLLRLSVELNTKVPLHLGAAAKVLLAYQSETFIDVYIQNELPKFGDQLKTNKNDLKSQLIQIKRSGYYFADGEAQSWLKGIAAPIFDINNHIIASVALVMPYDRLDNDDIDKLVGFVKSTAQNITKELYELHESKNLN